MSAESFESRDLFDLAHRRPLTIADLPDGEDAVGRTELIDGSIFVTPGADLHHQLLVGDVYEQLLAVCPSGLRVVSPVNVIEEPSTLVEPDVAVIDPAMEIRNGLGVPPRALALAIEVTSKSTRWRDLGDKRELYQRWGVPYLVIDRRDSPSTRNVFGTLPSWARSLHPASIKP